ncbi:Tetratricopeptide repeat-containing protein [Pustulibacterium marinum]|uniref:Tetratricopeptide repeat-containing protein n=1 Tax=Pustulibacterium marinum TaxID=1224947 RepID=A0A1I7G5F1_9FLAO|nr:tetratricopeptide repeat protein [Pustulibacterium marinum]SFU43664.1 Tetratricopeptide repeat-containing protein [Pustulibacterium marinum]
MPFGSNEEYNLPIAKFESMLKTNTVFFFDSTDFEHIITYYLDEGKVAKAKKATQIGLEQHPTSSELKLLEVEILIFENKLDKAEALLEDLEEICAHNVELYIQKANIFSKKDMHQKAIQTLKQALAVNGEDPAADILSMIGMEFLFLEDYANAKDYFLEALKEDHLDYAALYNVVFCYEYLADHDGCITFLNDFLEVNPYCEVAWHQLGKQYAAKKLYKESLSAFEFAIISDDSFIGAYFEKGKILEKLKRYNEAIDNYEYTLELDDPTSFAYLRIGKCHEKLGNLDLAKQNYYKTVHEDPLLDKGWLAITDFYYRLENFQKAKYYIQKAINIDEDNVLYWKRSAEIHKQLSMFEEADIAYKKTIELGNYELDTWVSWADILTHLGENDTAIVTLLQGLEFYPEDSGIEYRLAALYYLMHEDIKGQYHLTNALEHNYDGHELASKLFPAIFDRPTVKNIITKFKKAS